MNKPHHTMRPSPPRLLLAAVLLPLATLSAAAQQTLTLGEAISQALRVNPAIQTSRYGVSNAEAQINEAKSGTLPTINLSAQYQRNLQRPVFFFPGQDGVVRPIEIGSDNAITATLSVQQIVYNNAAFEAPNTAEKYGEVSSEQLRSDATQTVLNIRRAYLGAQYARRVVTVQQQLLANSTENQRLTSALFRAGLRAELDTITAAVQVANLRPAVTQANDTYESSLDQLRVAVGYGPDKRLEPSDELVLPTTDVKVPSLEEARSIMAQNNPQLRALRLTNDVNQDLVEIKRSDMLPTVSVFGQYQLQSQTNDLLEQSFQPSAAVGINLSYNIFNGGKTTAQVEQARVTLEQGRTRLQQTQIALDAQLQSTLRRIAYAQQRIATSAQTIAQAEKGQRLAAIAYKAGTGTPNQINDADVALAQARLNQLSAAYDFNVGLAELEGLLGQEVKLNATGTDVIYTAGR